MTLSLIRGSTINVQKPTENLTNAQQQYLADQMGMVSRSFALVAPEVGAPLDHYLAAAYLVCRVVDNIEDTLQEFSWKQERYTEFVRLLDAPQTAAGVLAGWEAIEWPGLSADEQHMMTREGGLMLWEIIDRLPRGSYAAIRRWTAIMAEGMARSNDPSARDFFMEVDDIRLPRTEADYNQYCFYVAGTVGRMISDLATEVYEIKGPAVETLGRDSEACGRALQKTNIVKDFTKDLARGDCYLPDEWLREIDYAPLIMAGAPAFWKQKILLDVVGELDSSVNYVLSLPQTAVGLRKAGLLMMMPAYETILQAAQRLPHLFTPGHQVKISRLTMGQCVLRARKIAADDQAICSYTEEMSATIKRTLASQSSGTT